MRRPSCWLAVQCLTLTFLFVGAPCLVYAQTPIPRPTMPPMETGTAAISGVAIDARTGAPLPGALVYLGPPTHGPAGQPVSVVTDAKGRFVFAHLPEYGSYFINASKFGYFDGHYGRSSGGGGPSAYIPLTAGQWVRDLRIPLNPSASISGTVTDEHNEPIVSATVRVLTRVMVGGQMQLAVGPSALTDDLGHYRIAGLAPGKYYVQMPSVQSTVPAASTAVIAGRLPDVAARNETAARAVVLTDAVLDVDDAFQMVAGRYPVPPRGADGKLQAYPVAFSPAGSSIAGASTIAVEAGDAHAGADIQVAPVAVSRLSGRVDGPPGSYLNLLLRLMPSGAEDLGAGSEAATSLVAADGSFTFLNVPAGSYVIDANRTQVEFQAIGNTSPAFMASAFGLMTAVGYRTLSGAPEGTRLGYRVLQGDNYFARQPISIGSADTNDVVVSMHRGITISGRIERESTEPGNTTSIMALPANGAIAMSQGVAPMGRENPDVFSIRGLMPGRYLLQSTNTPGMKSIRCAGRDYTNVPIEITDGADVTDCVATLTGKQTVLRGVVTPARADEGHDHAVIVFPAEREQWTEFGANPPRIKSAQADTAGGYRFGGLSAGDYLVIAVSGDQIDAWRDPGFLPRAVPLASKVHLNWDETTRQDLAVKVVK